MHPKWTVPSKCQKLLIHCCVLLGHMQLFTVDNEYAPYFSNGRKFVCGLSFPLCVRVIKLQTGKEERKATLRHSSTLRRWSRRKVPHFFSGQMVVHLGGQGRRDK